MLLSTRAKSGYKYVIHDKRDTRGKQWKVNFKKYRSHGFITALEGAQYFAQLFPEEFRKQCKTTSSANVDISPIVKIPDHPVPAVVGIDVVGNNDPHDSESCANATYNPMWWNKERVRVSKQEIDGMQLFGIRVMFVYAIQCKRPTTKAEKLKCIIVKIYT